MEECIVSAKRIDSVDDYLATIGPEQAATMREIIDAILTEYSETHAAIAWNVPHIKLGKDYVFGMSAAKHHITLNPWSTQVIDDFRPRLEPEFTLLKTTFQIPDDWNVDRDLLRDLVRARIAELDTE